MKYSKATAENAEQVYTVVQKTIKTIYPRYYPQEVVDFFCQLHSKDKIESDIADGTVGILTDGGSVIGTGCCREHHITRVYVLPEHQRKGYGSYLMQCLEEKIGEGYDKICLDASLPASLFYEKRGYTTVRHCKLPAGSEAILVYEIMEKEIACVTSAVNYDEKFFLPKYNTENGEVDGRTLFAYHQKGEILFADYSGGEIKKGHIIGKVGSDGELDFTYHHINVSGQIKSGICHSIPVLLDNAKIELHEKWQWLGTDQTTGTSILTEC